jgi:hypothetical protein
LVQPAGNTSPPCTYAITPIIARVQAERDSPHTAGSDCCVPVPPREPSVKRAPLPFDALDIVPLLIVPPLSAHARERHHQPHATQHINICTQSPTHRAPAHARRLRAVSPVGGDHRALVDEIDVVACACVTFAHDGCSMTRTLFGMMKYVSCYRVRIETHRAREWTTLLNATSQSLNTPPITSTHLLGHSARQCRQQQRRGTALEHRRRFGQTRQLAHGRRTAVPVHTHTHTLIHETSGSHWGAYARCGALAAGIGVAISKNAPLLANMAVNAKPHHVIVTRQHKRRTRAAHGRRRHGQLVDVDRITVAAETAAGHHAGAGGEEVVEVCGACDCRDARSRQSHAISKLTRQIERNAALVAHVLMHAITKYTRTRHQSHELHTPTTHALMPTSARRSAESVLVGFGGGSAAPDRFLCQNGGSNTITSMTRQHRTLTTLSLGETTSRPSDTLTA